MSQPDNMSSKKRRRLDKYIEKKLKKEERLELFEKLSKSQAEIPTTAHLQSSSTLGAGKPHTSVERQYEIQAEEQSEDLATETISQEAVSTTTGSTARKQPRGDFKTWALSQLSTAKAYVAPVTIDSSLEISQHGQCTTIAAAPPPKRRKTESTEKHGPLGEDLQVPSNTLADDLRMRANRNALKSIHVTRSSGVEEARQLLPIVLEEQSIMEAILLNPIVIICGETGSGKTTQVPQFLYEAGFGSPGSDNPGMIGVTQPRRVAAMSMAARVGHELSLTSSCVSYQIRYDATVSPSTSVKFMTDGVLLRELATDLLLTKYSVIIVDEAHERSVNTDILIGVLSRVIKLREQMWSEGKDGVKPLRLIIMSATLRVSDFAENTTLFTIPPPIINISARQHPVTVHFNKRTVSDYVNEAVFADD
ncbi:hypothetical protein EWM64_g751 [Hericium alpestre]|uniref:RNA helicase n=1 Tax=Hericium alpestre TaxID=135208 RepID=A0A4Z0AA95_9AGAM|nr:hypothetical protein EWM64_g751 [Hericium alpestre]